MILGNCFRRCLPVLPVCTLLVSSVAAQGQVGSPRAVPLQSQVAPNPQAGAATPYRAAERPAPTPALTTQDFSTVNPGEHPLMPVLRWAHDGLKNAQRIQDYSATLVKRERIKDKLSGYEYMFVKIRHKPFSVYSYFLAPEALKGREVLYVQGRNDGKMWAHASSGWEKTFGTVSLNPTSYLAMRGQRYPLTEIGILTLVERLVEVGKHDTQYGECEVKYFRGAKVNDRICTCIECIHPVPRRDFLFHKVQIFVDDELNLVTRYASWGWPKTPGEPPPLLEEYTYLNLKLNNGFTDADFDVKNPNYGFK